MPEQSQANNTFHLSDNTKKQISSALWRVVDNSNESVDVTTFAQDLDYELMFVTLLNQGNVRCCIAGNSPKDHENRLWADLLTGTRGCLADKRFGGSINASEHNELEATVTLFHTPQQVKPNLDTIKKEIELGVHAIEVKQGKKRAFFKESVAISKNYQHKKLLEHLCTKAKLNKSCYIEPNTVITKFDTTTFHTDRANNIIDLYRYHPVITKDEITEDLLKNRLALAQLWFHNNWDEDNHMFKYQYYPSRDKYSSDNNLIRQIASVWVLSEINNEHHRPKLDDQKKIESALDFFLNQAKCSGETCYIDPEGEDAKIAYNAFAILALLNFNQYTRSEQWVERLSNALLSKQEPDGSFHTSFSSNKNSGQDFYPGEALLALMKVYEQNRDVKYLNKAKKSFNYYSNYWRENKNTAFVPWHSQAYKLLYEYTGDQEIADFVFEMNDWLIDNHQITESAYQDEVGGFPKPKPKGCSTAVYLEGLNDAYLTAKLTGDTTRATKYSNAIVSGLTFLLTTQYSTDNSFYLPNAHQAIGGFRSKLTNNTQRVDYIQHGSMALMKTIQNKILKY